MSGKEDVIIALLREVKTKLGDVVAATSKPTAEVDTTDVISRFERIEERQGIILAAIGEIYQRLDATDALPAYILEHEAAALLRENYPQHGPQPKAMRAVATAEARLKFYTPDQLRERAAFYRDKIEQRDPYAHQASKALKMIEMELSEREATKGPEPA